MGMVLPLGVQALVNPKPSIVWRVASSWSTTPVAPSPAPPPPVAPAPPADAAPPVLPPLLDVEDPREAAFPSSAEPAPEADVPPETGPSGSPTSAAPPDDGLPPAPDPWWLSAQLAADKPATTTVPTTTRYGNKKRPMIYPSEHHRYGCRTTQLLPRDLGEVKAGYPVHRQLPRAHAPPELRGGSERRRTFSAAGACASRPAPACRGHGA